ncbi:TIP41-like protein isoform X1 [Drosophila subobscura]|uniref:TIP41-like protein isoform X1 n=1 Tax=Drosophila subobscura TaxID=7241 RepID=UPI00155AF8F6|nr:TIP41-like protein isoform X1 [Drosophila subobscura]
MDNDCVVPRLPVDGESIRFNDWNISYEKSHILKSICKQGSTKCCEKDDAARCELCHYQYSLDLPHLPDMVFHKNKLVLQHKDGALMEFQPMDALALIDNGKQPQPLEVACAQEWRHTRCPEQTREEKFKPFDWTFTSTYQGTMNEKIRSETTDMTLNKFKLMQRENIIFYTDLTLFEDELHDHGISVMSVRIRVMPSGFFILLRHFLRIDDVLMRMNDTRFHHEIENDYILKEVVHREAPCDKLKSSMAFWTNPDEMQNYLPVLSKQMHKLSFK